MMVFSPQFRSKGNSNNCDLSEIESKETCEATSIKSEKGKKKRKISQTIKQFIPGKMVIK